MKKEIIVQHISSGLKLRSSATNVAEAALEIVEKFGGKVFVFGKVLYLFKNEEVSKFLLLNN